MGLIHWWPLNGNLNDIGIGNNSLTDNGGVAFSDSGKIGQCANIGSGKSLTTSDNLFNSYVSLSVAYWMKLNEQPSSDWYDIWHVGDFRAEIYSGQYMWTGYADGVCSMSGFNVGLNSWIHVVHVLDVVNKTYAVYFNGVQAAKGSFTSTAQLTGTGIEIGQGILNIDINDFRIYNHALSAKEVKEISKGLVLHYNFEDGYIEGTTNLSNYDWYTHWNNSGDATYNLNDTSLVSPTNSKIFSQTQTVVGQSAFGFAITGALPSKTITASCWFYKSGDSSTGDGVGPLIRGWDPDAWYVYLAYNGNTNYKEWPSDTWIYITATTTTNSNQQQVYICCYTGGANEKFAFTGWQIEEKDHATPYVNGTRPNGLIYDNSGYGYNGTQVGNLQILDNSPSGNKSAKFESNTYVDIPTLPEFSEVSYAFWIKIPTATEAYRSIFNVNNNPTGGLWLSLNTEGQGLWSYYASSPSYSGISGFISADTWIHCVFVFKDGYANWYKNGEYMGRDVYYPSLPKIPSNHYCLGNSYTGSYWDGTPFDGQIADFKIFSTALSASDILAEYNRKASIDRGGKLFTPYACEDSTLSNIKLGKDAVLNINTLAENITLEDGSVWTPIVIHNVNSGVFSGRSTTLRFETGERWTDFGAIDGYERPDSSWWEFLIMHQTEVNGSYRWWRIKQCVDPMTSGWSQVEPSNVGGNVIRIDSNVAFNYYGGLYWMDSAAAMCFANGSNGNWWGCGISQAYEGGIPSYNGEVCKGFQLVYMRVANPKTKVLKNGLVKTNELVEY